LVLGASAGGLIAYLLRSKQEVPVVVEETHPLRLLIPTYIYPKDDGLAQWERIFNSPMAGFTVVIVNTSSGPGTQVDSNYTKVIDRARRTGVTAIGYVSTSYGKRLLKDVKGDVDRWILLYPNIQGIFFDEQSSKADDIPYYATLYDYVKKHHGLSLVFTNPGTTCDEDYVARPAADVVCLFEVTKDFSTYQTPKWTERYPPERFAALLIKIPNAEEMKQKIRAVRDKRFGFCYVTDGDEPNPWGKLPRYWDEEVEAIRAVSSEKK
jgi:hypothetical protein